MFIDIKFGCDTGIGVKWNFSFLALGIELAVLKFLI